MSFSYRGGPCESCNCGCDDCAYCNSGTSPARMQVTLPSGVSESGCGDCVATWDGATFVLSRVGCGCEYTLVFSDCGVTVTMALVLGATDVAFTIRFTGGYAFCAPTWSGSYAAPYDCGQEFALANTNQGVFCPCGFPSADVVAVAA